jgi:hypothetical protein
MGWVARARERGLVLNKHLVETGEVFAGKAGLLFFKVDMIFEGRDAMLSPFEKGGQGDSLLPKARGDLYPKSESPAR